LFQSSRSTLKFPVNGILTKFKRAEPAGLGELGQNVTLREIHCLRTLDWSKDLRMVGKSPPAWQNRAHFFGVAARLMREILVDRTQKIRAAKRGAGAGELPLDEAIGLPHQRSVALILLDDALERLAKLDERQCRIVELRFFTGLSLEETSVALGISEATVSREWSTARLWLRREIARAGPP